MCDDINITDTNKLNNKNICNNNNAINKHIANRNIKSANNKVQNLNDVFNLIDHIKNIQ